MSVVVGTAGHIDHGKTALVRALTGKDTDRLPEEQARGISIELGYAPLDLPDGRRLSLVDVPATSASCARWSRARPASTSSSSSSTRARARGRRRTSTSPSCKLLGVDRGVVAVTKADAVDEETLALAVEEARELVPDAAVVATSATTEQGLDELRAALAAAADAVEPVHATGATRLFVDRVFTLHGIGTVATGTLWSGRIAAGDELRAGAGRPRRPRAERGGARPRRRRRARPVSASRSACPVSSGTQLRRGDALVEPGAYPTSFRLDVALEELEPIADGARVHVHHGTAEIPAVVRRIGDLYAQLRLTAPAVAARGDRLRAPREHDARRWARRRPRSAAPRQPRAARAARAGGRSRHRPRPRSPRNAAASRSTTRRPGWVGRAAGSSPRRGSPSIEARSSGSSTRPILSTLAFRRRPSRGRRPRTAARAGTTRREALPARAGWIAGRSDEEAAAELESRLGLEPVKVDDQRWPAISRAPGTLVRVGDRYAISRDAYERRARSSSRSAAPRAASRLRASATSSASAGAGAAAPRAVRRRRSHPPRRRRARAAACRSQPRYLSGSAFQSRRACSILRRCVDSLSSGFSGPRCSCRAPERPRSLPGASSSASRTCRRATG